MGLFGKKKKEGISPEELGFGFPATKKKKEVEGVTEVGPEAELPPPPEAPAAPTLPKAPTMTPQGMPTPEPIPVQPAPAAMPAQEIPKLEPRPMIPVTMPEDIQAPMTPKIQKLRPHVFLKISKYKEVMSSIDKIVNHLKDLKKSLKNIKEVEEKETIKIKESENLLLKLEEVAGTFDKIFSNPEK